MRKRSTTGCWGFRRSGGLAIRFGGFKTWSILAALVVGLTWRDVVPSASAVNYTWTNTQNNAGGYWTNGVLWGQSLGTYPGIFVGDSAYLTNQFSGAATNILDTTQANPILNLAISNSLGEAWLIITNATLLNAGTGGFTLDSGGRLQIATNGLFSQNAGAGFTWLGTNGAIYLNNGGQLLTAPGITLGFNVSGVTGLVSSLSATGGVWNLNSQGLAFSNNFNGLTVNNVTLTNISSVAIGAAAGNFGNSLALSNGANFFSGALTVGAASGASNNVYNVGGLGGISTISNGVLIVGTNGASANRLILTNANYWSTGLTVGSGATNNVVTVYGNTPYTWNFGGGLLQVGSGTGINADTGNVFQVIGSTAGLTNIGGINFYDANNSLFLSNQNFRGSVTGFNLGAPGEGNNSLSFSSQILTSSTGTIIGSGSSNNILTVLTNTFWNANAQTLTIGTSNAAGNVFAMNGGTVTNWGAVVIGNTATAVGNGLTISNGAGFFSSTVTIGNVVGASNNYYNVGGLGAASIVSNSTITLSAAGVGFNSMTVTNATLLSGGLNVGSGSSNNTLTVLAGTVWNMYGNQGLIGNGLATGNVMIVNGGMISNTTFAVGNGSTAFGNTLIMTNGAVVLLSGGNGATPAGVGGYSAVSASGGSSNLWLITGAGTTLGATGGVAQTFVVGPGGYATGNVLRVENGAVATNIALVIGYNRTGAPSAGNSVIISNGGKMYLTGGQNGQSVGNGQTGSSSSNTLIVAAGGLLDVGGVNILIGTAGSSSNSLTVDGPGAVVTNAGTGFTIGNGLAGPPITNATANSLNVRNGASLFSGAIAIGSLAGDSNNAYNVGGGVAAVSVSNGTITVAGTFNTMTVTNANLMSGTLTIGSGSSNNTVIVQGTSPYTWNFLGGVLQVGSGTGINADTGNLFQVIGSTAGLTNLGGINFYDANNSLFLSNQNLRGFIAGFNLGSPGEGGVSLTLSNQTVTNTTAASVIGNGGTNNVLALLTNTVWNVGGQAITIGSGAATGNVLVVNGGILTNVVNGAVTIGGTTGNSLIISNGGQMWGGAVSVNGSNDSYLIGGAGAASFVSNSTLTIGASGVGYANMTLTNATLITQPAQTINVGNGSSNNTVYILTNGTWTAPAAAGGGSRFNIGNGAATGNVVTVNGGTLNMGYIYVGASAGANGNSLFVTNGTVNTTILTLPSQNSALILGAAGNFSNTITLVGNSVWTAPAGGISMSIGGATNTLLINNSMITNFSYLSVGGYGNTLILTNNAKLFVTPDPYSASSSLGNSTSDSNNTIYVLAGSLYSELSGQANQSGIGRGGGVGNQLIVNGGTYTNSIYLALGGFNNGVTVTNGQFTVAGLYVGYTPSSVAASYGSNDYFNLLPGSTANLNNNPMAIGNSSSTVAGNSNSATLNGAILTNAGLITVGANNGGGSGFNTLTATNATLFSAGLTIGAAASSTNTVNLLANSTWNMGGVAVNVGNAAGAISNAFNVTGATLTNAGLITIGGAGGGFNSMTITNANLWSAGLTIGAGSSNSTVTVLNAVTWNFLRGALTWSSGAANGNALNTPSGTYGLTNIGGINLGDINVTLVLTNQNLSVGGALNVGTQPGQGGNTLTLSNQTYTATALSTIGNGSGNNLLNILSSTIWSNGGFGITIGNGSGIGNSVLVNGGIVTNVGAGAVTIGNGGALTNSGNSLSIYNGGQWFGGAVTVGAGGSSNDAYNVGGSGAASTVSNGAITVGGAGGIFNTMTVTNVNLLSSGGLTVGSANGTNNIAAVGPVTWNLLGGAVSIGNAAGASSNVLNLTGGIVTNVAVLTVGGTGGNYNMLTVTNGQLWTTGAATIGSGGNSNTVTLAGGGLWNMGGSSLSIGSGVATGNVLILNGSQLTNVNGVTISVSATTSAGNSLTLTNGAQLYTISGGSIFVGGGASGSATLTMSDTSYLQTLGGNALYAYTNGVIVQSGGTINTAGFTLNGGQAIMSGGLLISPFIGVGHVPNSGSSAPGTLTFSGGLIQSTGAAFLGGGVGNVGGGTGTVYQSGGAWDLGGNNLSIGSAGATYNGMGIYNMTGGFLTNGSITLGNSLGGIGTLTVSGPSYIQLAGGPLYVGYSGTGFVYQTGGVINGNGQALNFSYSGGQGTYVLNGGVMTNFSAINMGNASAFNSMTISNGGVLVVNGLVSVAYNTFASSSNNTYNVGGLGLSSLVSNGGINVGYIGGSAGGGNSMTVTNATLVSSGGLTIGIGAYSNTVNVLANASYTLNGSISLGTSASSTNSMTINAGVVTNVQGLSVGTSAGANANSFLVTNGGKFFMTSGGLAVGSTAAGAAGGNNNSVVFSNNVLTANAAAYVGTTANSNALTLLANTRWDNANQSITIGNGVATGNVLTINGALLSGGGVLTVGTGANSWSNQLIISGNSTVTVASLNVWTNNFVTFNSGILNLGASAITNGNNQVFAVGTVSGTTTAVLNTVSGNQLIGNGLTVYSNSWLTGVGNIQAGGPGIVLTNGAYLSPGLGTNGIGTLTLNNVYGQNGVVYDVQIAALVGSAGQAWDLLNVTGVLTNTTAGAVNTNFVIRMDSMNQLLTGYSPTTAYSLLIANLGTNLYVNNFVLDTNSFLGAGSGLGKWQLVVNGSQLFLQQSGAALVSSHTFVWTNASAAWSLASAWTNSPGPTLGGGADYVLQFNANAGGTTYTATNNLTAGATSFTNNSIIFNSATVGTNYLVGSNITFAGSANAAGFYQNNSSTFVVSNVVTLTTNIVFDGAGFGTVILASNVTGSGQLTKQGGAWNTVLLGSNNFIGPVLVNSSGTLTLGNLAAIGTNSITVSNGAVVANLTGTSYIVGNGVSNQSVLISGTSSLWSNTAALAIGSGAAVSNVVTIANGGFLIATAVNIGSNSTATANGLIISNGGNVIGGAINVGSAAGSASNFYNILGGGTVTNGAITVGTAGAGYNRMSITNATLLSGGAIIVGNNSSNNTISVLPNSFWNLGAQALTIGTGVATGNVLSINGGVATNVGTVLVGGTLGSFGNLLSISNGSAFFSGSVTLGNAAGASNNAYNMGGFGAISTVSNGLITVGGGGNGNTLTATNATIWSSGLTIGSGGASSNTVTVQDNVTWNLLGGALTFNGGGGIGSLLNVVAGTTNTVLTNINSVIMAGGGATFAITTNATGSRNIILGQSTTVNNGSLAVGATAGFGGNTLLVSNQTFILDSNGNYQNGYVGVGSSNNTLILLANTIIDGGGGSISVGSGAAFGNLVQVIGGVISNFGNVARSGGTIGQDALSISNQMLISGGMGWFGNWDSQGNTGYQDMFIVGASGSGNSLIVSNGGFAGFYGSPTLGLNAGANGNFMIVTGSGSTVTNLGGGNFMVGRSSSSNSLRVANGGVVFLATSSLTVGNYGSNNLAIVTDAGSALKVAGASFAVGANTNSIGNSLVVSNGALLVALGGTVGGAPNANSNTVLVTGSGTVWSNQGALIIGAATNQFNRVTISDGAAMLGGGAVTLGNAVGASNNYYNVGGAGGQVTVSNGLVTIGGSGSGYNVMMVTNANLLSAGLTFANYSTNNLVAVTNATWNLSGSQLVFGLAQADSLAVGQNGNSFLTNVGGIGLLGTGQSFYLTNATGPSRNILLGTGGSLTVGIAGLGSDTLTISNQTYTAGAASVIGNGSSSNVLTLLGDTAFLGGFDLTIGAGTAGSNNVVNVGGTGGASILSNGQISLSANGNAMTITNATVLSAKIGGFYFNVGGNNASSNTVTVLANGVLAPLGNGITIGGAAGTGNVLSVNGGVITNYPGVDIGGFAVSGGIGNMLLVTNGGQAYLSSVLVGYQDSTANVFKVTGPGSVAILNGAINVGSQGTGGFTGASNQMIVANGGVVSNSSTASIGTTINETYNSALVTGAGSIWTNVGAVTVGGFGGAIYNSLTVTNSGMAIFGAALNIGTVAGANSNTVTVAGGGYLQAGAVTLASGGTTGNVLNVTSGGTNWDTSLIVSPNALDWSNIVNVSGGTLIVTNSTGTGQINVGSVGMGILNLNSGGSLLVNQLLVTNNFAGIQTNFISGTVTSLVYAVAPTNNSFFTFGSGTLVTSNGANAIAARIVVQSNTTYAVSGTWIMLGGTNIIDGAAGSGSTFSLGANSSLVLSNGAKFNENLLPNISVGANAKISVSGTGSVLTITNNTAATGAGLNMNVNGGSITVANGGQLAGYSVVLGSGNAAPSFALVTGPGSVWTNYANNTQGYSSFTLDGGSGVTISNGGALYVGYSVNGGYLLGGANGTANGNWTIVTGTGSVLNVNGGQNASLQVGSGVSGSNNTNWVLVANGGGLLSTGVIIGRRAAGGNTANSNSVTVTDPGSYWNNNGPLNVGGESGGLGTFVNNNYNYVIISNGASLKTVGANIGVSAPGVSAPANQYNGIIVTGSGSIMTNTSSLNIGYLYTDFNYLTLTNGATYVGSGVVQLGYTNAYQNTLNVYGSTYSNTGALTIGGGPNASNNAVNVVGTAAASSIFYNSGLISVGSPGAGSDSMFVSNATVSGGGLLIGNGSSNNTVTVQDNTVWDFLGTGLKFGQGTGNVLNITPVSSTYLTNVGGIVIADANRTLLLTNATGSPARNIILGNGGSISVGDSLGWGNNTLLISNQTFKTTGASQVGNGSSNNILTIFGNTVWDGNGGGLTIGTGAATGNVLTVNGGVATNNGAVVIGGTGGSSGNSLVITSGGQMAGTTVSIGATAPASNNTAVVMGIGSVWSNSGLMTVGGGNYNSFTAAQGAQVTVDNFTVGGSGNSNQVVFTGTGTVVRTTSTSILSFSGSYNSLIVSNGAQFYEAAGGGNQGYLRILGANSFNNQLIVTGTGSVYTVGSSSGITWIGGGTNAIIVADAGVLVIPQIQITSSNSVLVTGGGVLTNTGGA